MLTAREAAAVEACVANLDKVDAHPDYVNGGKFSVEPDDNPTRGKSYLAASALQIFLGGLVAGYSMMKATSDSLGDHHWVVNDAGAVLDPTKEQFELIGSRPPYRRGRKTQRRNTLKEHLPLLEAMRESLDGDSRVTESQKLVDIVGRPLVVERESVLSDAQQEKLTEAWRTLVAEWASRPEEFIRCAWPKGTLAVQFVRALLYGEEIPRTATMAYTWDRYHVAGSHYPFNEMLPRAVEDPRVLRGIRFVLAGDLTFHQLIARSLPVLGYRIPADFPISLARDMIDRYCPAGGAVLDPCHGWGGRMVGFMLSKASTYVGVDPAPHSPKLQEMFDDLSPYLFEPKRIKLINKPFEDTALRDSAYDFAITSPPYFNIEKYKGEESSWRRYKTLDAWVDGFYRALITGVAEALKPGARFVLQVTPKFRMVDAAKEIGNLAGLVYERVYDTSMRRYNSASADKAGSADTFEVYVVLRKQGVD